MYKELHEHRGLVLQDIMGVNVNSFLRYHAIKLKDKKRIQGQGPTYEVPCATPLFSHHSQLPGYLLLYHRA